MTVIQSTQKPSWWLVIITIVAYLGWFVIAGHGAIPMGFLLIFGLENWVIPVLFGWAAIIIIFGGKLFNRFEPIILGITFILISWLIILYLSEAIAGNVVTSIPFLICIFFLGKKSLNYIKSYYGNFK